MKSPETNKVPSTQAWCQYLGLTVSSKNYGLSRQAADLRLWGKGRGYVYGSLESSPMHRRAILQ